jgi:Ni/Fe-hydrogenase subunit HybB-like protein
MFCNVVAPLILWSKKARTSLLVVFICATFANIGMWFERFVIIVTSLSRDFLPSSWWLFKPTIIDIAMLAGSFGLFFTLFLLFCRYLPVVAMAEVKSIMPQAHAHPEKHEDLSGDEFRTDYRPDEHFRPKGSDGH